LLIDRGSAFRARRGLPNIIRMPTKQMNEEDSCTADPIVGGTFSWEEYDVLDELIRIIYSKIINIQRSYQ
jgi:hypothetical protein